MEIFSKIRTAASSFSRSLSLFEDGRIVFTILILSRATSKLALAPLNGTGSSQSHASGSFFFFEHSNWIALHCRVCSEEKDTLEFPSSLDGTLIFNLKRPPCVSLLLCHVIEKSFYQPERKAFICVFL